MSATFRNPDPADTDSSFLYLDALHCKQQREWSPGRDTPYLLVFTGQYCAQKRSDVVRVTSPHWQDAVGTGDLLRPATWVHHHVVPDTLIAVALIEQSWRLDVDAPALATLRHEMQRRWRHITSTATGSAATPSTIGFAARHAFGQQIHAQLKNDALIEVCHLPVPAMHGPLPTICFEGGDAHYEVSFSLRAV